MAGKEEVCTEGSTGSTKGKGGRRPRGRKGRVRGRSEEGRATGEEGEDTVHSKISKQTSPRACPPPAPPPSASWRSGNSTEVRALGLCPAWVRGAPSSLGPTLLRCPGPPPAHRQAPLVMARCGHWRGGGFWGP